MRNTPLFILTSALFLGLLASFYEFPLWVSLPFLFLVFLFYEVKRALYLIFFFLLFYGWGNFYFHLKPSSSPLKEGRFFLKIERVEPYYEKYKVFAQAEALGRIEFIAEKKGFKPGLICEVFLSKKRWYERLNPFYPEEREIYQIRGVEGIFKLNEREKVYCIEGKGNPFEILRYRLFTFSEELSPLARGLFLALVLGVENQLPKEYLETLKSQGLYHQLAISGFNLAVLYGLLYKIFRSLLGYTPLLKLEIPLQVWAYLFSLPGALLILILSGFQPPTLRAFFFLIVYLLSKFLFRNTPSLLLLFLAGALLLGLDPTLIGNLSFQLSFLATLALLLGDKLLRERFLLTPQRFFPEKLLYTLGLSTMVSLFTFPLIVRLSGEIPLASPINNLLATPFWSLLFIPLSILSALLSLISETLAKLIMEITAKIFSFYLKIPLFELLFRPALPTNLFLGWCLFLFLLGILLWKSNFKIIYKVFFFFFLGMGSYFLLKEFYNKTHFLLLPKFYTLKAFLIKEGPNFYLITEENEKSALERNQQLIPLLKKFGIREFEGIIFLKASFLKEYQRHFFLREVYQDFDLFEEGKRPFKPGVEFIPLGEKGFLIELRGLTLLYFQGKKAPPLKAEVYLNPLIKKRDSAYFFFPKENYILVISERERRRNFLTNLLFPFIPYYFERGDIEKLYYDKLLR